MRRTGEGPLEHFHRFLKLVVGHQIHKRQQAIRFEKIRPEFDRSLQFRRIIAAVSGAMPITVSMSRLPS